MADLQQNLDTIDNIQQGNVEQILPFHTHNGIDSPLLVIAENELNLSDIASGNVSSTQHGFAPKSPADATQFLNGAATPAFAQVKDSDLSTSDITTNNVSITKHGFVPKAPNNTSQFLRADGTWANAGLSVAPMNAGETLVAGEFVTVALKSGSPKVIRAAADDTTYGAHCDGIVAAGVTIGGVASIAAAGYDANQAGMTGASTQYLSNHDAVSTLTITQTGQDSEQTFAVGVTVVQIFVPTSSRIDTATFFVRKNGGGADSLTVQLKRASTVLATAAVDMGANSATLSEKTVSFGGIQTYKGETLTFSITDTSANGTGFIGYKASTAPYNGGASGGSIPANSDLYFKTNEFLGFGKPASSAGTRKIKVGTAISATEIQVIIQHADAIL